MVSFTIDGRTIAKSTKTADKRTARLIFENERAKYIRLEKLGDLPDIPLKNLLDTYLKDYGVANKKSYKGARS